jgi:hypothetical protein
VLLIYQELPHCGRPEIAYVLIPCRITSPAGKSAQPTKLAAKQPLLSAAGKPTSVFRLWNASPVVEVSQDLPSRITWAIRMGQN